MTLRDAGRLKPPVIIATVLCLCYLIIHLLTLTLHPFIHSDEAWLASLTRAMLQEHSVAAVEESFRLTPRYPHALKTLYHLIQMPFLVVSWNVFAARLPSLLAGLASIFLLIRIADGYKYKGFYRYMPAVLMAADPQFWYLSHLARQEMLLVMLFLLAWNLKVRKKPAWLTALPVVAGIFVHPNSFIMAVGLGALYLPVLLKKQKGRALLKRYEGFSSLLVYCLTLAVGAALALALSYLMDTRFLYHYRNFGNSVGTGDSMFMKLLGLPQFLIKMLDRHAGTYYLAEVRFFYVAGAIGTLLALAAVVARWLKTGRDIAGQLLVLPAMLAAMVSIGKYGPPTIGLLMAPSYLLLVAGLSAWMGTSAGSSAGSIFRRFTIPVFGLLVLSFMAYTSTTEIQSSAGRSSYREYCSVLNSSIGSEGRILMNLNGAFAFDYDRLVIWRDLDSLSQGENLEAFLDEQDVRWIVVPEELSLIYESRPVWNGLYGNPRWYPELMEVIEERGTLVVEAAAPAYAMRIVPYMDRKDWSLAIYRIE